MEARVCTDENNNSVIAFCWEDKFGPSTWVHLSTKKKERSGVQLTKPIIYTEKHYYSFTRISISLKSQLPLTRIPRINFFCYVWFSDKKKNKLAEKALTHHQLHRNSIETQKQIGSIGRKRYSHLFACDTNNNSIISRSNGQRSLPHSSDKIDKSLQFVKTEHERVWSKLARNIGTSWNWYKLHVETGHDGRFSGLQWLIKAFTFL